LSEFIKYPKVKYVGEPENRDLWNSRVYVEEKIDGANFRFGWIGGVFRFGSRNVELTKAGDSIPKNFRKAVEFVQSIKDKLRPCYIYFAEATIPHTIQYDWSKMPYILGFDIWDCEQHRFVDYDLKVKMFEEADIQPVPLIKVLNSKPSQEELKQIIPMSQFYDGTAEGVVFKNYRDQVIAKLVSKKFKEVNRSIFGKHKKEIKDETEKFVEYAFSPQRIEKKIYELRDEGYELSMKMMQELIYRLVEDAFTEEWRYLFFKFDTVSFKRARKMLSKRAQNILRMIIARESLR